MCIMETSKSWPKRLFHLVRRSSAASQAHQKRGHFTRRRPNEVRTLNGGALKTNVSRVSLCVVESLYWWMFDLYQFSVDDVRLFARLTLHPKRWRAIFPRTVWRRAAKPCTGTGSLRFQAWKSHASIFPVSNRKRFQSVLVFRTE